MWDVYFGVNSCKNSNHNVNIYRQALYKYQNGRTFHFANLLYFPFLVCLGNKTNIFFQIRTLRNSKDIQIVYGYAIISDNSATWLKFFHVVTLSIRFYYYFLWFLSSQKQTKICLQTVTPSNFSGVYIMPILYWSYYRNWLYLLVNHNQNSTL